MPMGNPHPPTARPQHHPVGGAELNPGRKHGLYAPVVIPRNYIDRFEEVKHGVEEPGDNSPVDVLNLSDSMLYVPEDRESPETKLLGQISDPLDHPDGVSGEAEPLLGQLLL